MFTATSATFHVNIGQQEPIKCTVLLSFSSAQHDIMSILR